MAKDNGLPAALEAEKFVLGSILLNNALYLQAAQALDPEDFSSERNQTIFRRMADLDARGVAIDRMTVANELSRYQELGSDGLSYLASLDEGLPQVPNLTSYAGIVKEKARLRRYVHASRKVAKAAMLGEKLSGEIYREAQAEFAQISDGANGSAIQTPLEFIKNYPGGVSVMLDPSKWKPGVPIGFKQLDAWTAGLHECEILLVGARPGVGKSAWACCVAKSLAIRGYPPAFFSLEMSKEAILQRMFCQEAGVAVERFRAGELLEDEQKRVTEAVGFVADLPIYLDDQAGLTVPEIRTKLQGILNDKPVSVAIIDFVQLLRPSAGSRYQNENEMFTRISNELQELAKSTRVPLILLSQLNRESTKAGADKRPKLSECRGSGSWEQIANVGALLYREAMVRKDRTDKENVAEMIIDKNRSGPSGTILLEFTGFLMRFRDPD